MALTSLNVIEQEKLLDQATQLQPIMRKQFENIADQTGMLTNIRGIGAVVAADLVDENLPDRAGYKLELRTFGFKNDNLALFYDHH